MIASVSFALVLSAAAALASPHDSRSHHDLIAKRREGDNNITKRDSFTNKEFTWYGTGTGADACTGKDHSDDDYYVAMGYDQYGSGGCCGKRMQLNYKSKSIIVECVDECASCPQWGQLDLTKGVFEYLIGDLGIGEVSASWSYVSDTAKLGPVTGDSGSDDTTTKKSSSSSTKKATSTKEAAPTTSSTKHTTQTPTTTHISTPAETPKTSKSTTADAPANTSSDNDDEDDGEDCEEEDDEDSGDDGEECEADDGDDEDDGEECEADDGDAEDESATTTTHKAVVVATSTHTPTSTKEMPVVTSSSTKEKPVTSSSDVEEEEPYTSVTSTKIATSSAKASSSAKPSSTVASSTAVVANVADTPSTTSSADDSTESSDDSTAPITGALSGAASNGVNPLFVAAAAIVLAAVAL